MEFSVDHLQQIKRAVHIAQALFIFVAWVIMIAVFHSALLIDSRPGWYFGLCFLSVPAIIYESMTLIFPKSRKYANVYAFAAVDVFFTIAWLSAFASVAAWNSTGLCFGACNLSEADVGLGFFIFLFFGITSAMSLYSVMYFQRNGTIPGDTRIPTNAAMIDPDREAFSTALHDDEYARVQMAEHDEGPHEAPDGGHSEGQGYQNVSYGRSGRSGNYAPPSVTDDPSSTYTYAVTPEPLQTGYDEERIRFPAGNYD